MAHRLRGLREDKKMDGRTTSRFKEVRVLTENVLEIKRKYSCLCRMVLISALEHEKIKTISKTSGTDK